MKLQLSQKTFHLSDCIEEIQNTDTIISKDHSFIRLHRRNPKHRYNYRYSIKELIPWIDKVKEIAAKTNTLRIYFNNHYGGKAVINALQFKDILELAISNK